MKNHPAMVWGLVSVGVLTLCALFTCLLYPTPRPLDEQLDDFSRTVTRDDLWHAGVVKHGAGELNEAIALYTQSIEAEADSTMAYLYRGSVYYERADYAQAIQEYTQALTIDPVFTWALNARGVAHYRNGNPEAAQADFQQSLDLDPNFIGPFINQAVIQRLNGNTDGALLLLSQAKEFSVAVPPSLDVLEVEGDIHYTQGKLHEALNSYSTIVDFYPEQPAAYRARALIYRALGDEEKAHSDELQYQTFTANEHVEIKGTSYNEF